MQDNNEAGASPAPTLRFAVMSGYLVQEVDYCTCGMAGIDSYGHEAGCGIEPVMPLSELADMLAVPSGQPTEAGRVEREVRELVARHHAAQVSERGGDLPWWVGYQVATAELANILEPGSAPMLPRDFGHAATCGTCMPDGDGVSKWSDR